MISVIPGYPDYFVTPEGDVYSVKRNRLAIRASKELTHVEARRYGVSKNTIRRVRSREDWSHVP